MSFLCELDVYFYRLQFIIRQSIDCTSVVDSPLHRQLSISDRKRKTICSGTPVNN